jgi:alpha-beta hydrolase superfamily lysophospholipase
MQLRGSNMEHRAPVPASKKILYESLDGTRLSATWQNAVEPSRGVVVLAHGITATREEDGVFTKLAEVLAQNGLHSLRFDFRGHGASGGAQEEMTLTGELKDLTASVNYARSCSSLPLGIVAASFGAASACCYSEASSDVRCLVLWNPVLDLRKTFLEPELPWAQQSFNPQGFAFLKQHGYLLLDGHFKIGRRLIEQMRYQRPYECVSRLQIPVLTLHGDQDTYVPYEVSRRYGKPNLQSQFVTVPSSEHGFGRQQDQDLVIPQTVTWFLINLQHPQP